jgi:hypothetical protein
MLVLMARRAECNQIIQSVSAELAPLCQVMNLQVLRRPAVLASPAISFEHPVAEYAVFFDAKLQSGALLAKLPHVLLRPAVLQIYAGKKIRADHL